MEGKEITQQEVQPFKGSVDRYKGLEITDLSQFPLEIESFRARFQASFDQWKQDGIRSVQIKFTPPYCHLMNVASEFGFYFHHASPKGNYVLMCLWMDQTTHDKIPAYADHYVGVGGIVVNDKDEILLIQERRSPEPRPWKFPGGFMDPGENIKQASEREVMEETGVKATFVGLMGVREWLETSRYGTSDFYIVCLMKLAGTGDINIIDKREVFDAKWVHISELSSNDEGVAQYKLFANAWKFIQNLHRYVMASKEKDQTQSAFDILAKVALSQDKLSVKDITHESQLKWNYYIPALLKEEHHL